MKFKILYVDPPWSYKVYSKKGQGRSAENHYHTMDIDDICNLDINSIADDDCVLFLWVTFPCLLEGAIATKGKPKRESKAVHSIIESPIDKHSKKPNEVRERIVKLMGDIPRAELFAREKYDGWTCLGNEIDGLDIKEAIENIKNMEEIK